MNTYRVEFLLAYNDHTWDTVVVNVPEAVDPTADDLIPWAISTLGQQAQYKNVAVFAVYGLPR